MSDRLLGLCPTVPPLMVIAPIPAPAAHFGSIASCEGYGTSWGTRRCGGDSGKSVSDAGTVSMVVTDDACGAAGTADIGAVDGGFGAGS